MPRLRRLGLRLPGRQGAEGQVASAEAMSVRAAPGRLLERERELAEVERLLDRVHRGAGELLVVESPAGAGKTRLIEAVAEAAGERAACVLSATASELERDLAFGVVRSLFGPVLARSTAARRRSLLSGAAGLAAAVVAPHRSGPELSAADPASVLHGLFWLTSNLAEHGPLVLAIDDAHWADRPSLRFAAYLARRLDGLGVLLAVAARPREPGGEEQLLSALIDDPRANVVRLAPLSQAAVGTLVSGRLPGAADERFCAACHAASGGNPFLVGELLSALASDGVAPVAANAERIGELGSSSVARAVLARLTRIGREAIDLAQAVAVLGGRAELRHAAALCGLEGPAAARAADALASIEVLAPTRPLTFVHPLVQNAVYDSIAPGARSLMHAAAARRLADEATAPDRVAAHLLKAERTGDPWVVQALADAAVEATARGSPDLAATYLRRALAEPPAVDRRVAVLHELGSVELLARDPVAVDHLAAALAETADADRRAALALLLGRAAVSTGRLADARLLLGAAIEELGEAHPQTTARLEAYRSAPGVWHPKFVGELDERAEGLHALAVRAGAAGRSLLLLLAFRSVFDGGPHDEVLALVEQGLDEGRLVQAESAEAIEVTWAVRTLTFIDELDRADRVVEAMVTDARRRGSVTGYVFATAWRAHIALRRGLVAAAAADARAAVELATEHGLHLLAPHAHAFLAEALIEQGAPDEARRVLTGAELGPMHGTRPESRFLHARAQARLACGERQAAIADLRACQEISESAAGFRNPNVFAWRSTLASALPEDAREDALALVELELDQARRIGQPRAIGVALRARALLSEKHDQIELLELAVATLERGPSRLEQARALVDLGAARRRAGRRADAREPLRRGLDLAAACGASVLAARAREELVAAGARPRRERLSGREALTASERRVALMAADGMSNREIAQALFVTMKTVAMHLTRSYDKLAISGRAELPAALGTVDSLDG
ncbi:MAG TPA: AAA family ATPase [Solirubrobacteraceae bacterium]|nr:AAA family ATPase [Solirubrobacteraceae bacterium]